MKQANDEVRTYNNGGRGVLTGGRGVEESESCGHGGCLGVAVTTDQKSDRRYAITRLKQANDEVRTSSLAGVSGLESQTVRRYAACTIIYCIYCLVMDGWSFGQNQSYLLTCPLNKTVQHELTSYFFHIIRNQQRKTVSIKQILMKVIPSGEI